MGEKFILRELLKSYVACRGDPLIPDSRSFATGNWGCGAFGGDPQLKSLIQWLAASATSRDMDYFVYGEKRMAEAQRVFGMLTSAGVTCGEVYGILLKAADKTKAELNLEAPSRGGVFGHMDDLMKSKAPQR